MPVDVVQIRVLGGVIHIHAVALQRGQCLVREPAGLVIPDGAAFADVAAAAAEKEEGLFQQGLHRFPDGKAYLGVLSSGGRAGSSSGVPRFSIASSAVLALEMAL